MRACQELGAANPILNAHDLGAGGDCNALPEIVEPAGAVIDLRAIPVGDQTLSVLEIWGNESQERNAVLIAPASLPIFETLSARENVPVAVVGRVTGDGVLVLYDSADQSKPVELPLDDILGQLPPKRFDFERVTRELAPLVLPPESRLPPGARPRPAPAVDRLQALPHQQGGPRRHRPGHPAPARGATAPASLRLRAHRPDVCRPLGDRASAWANSRSRAS